MIKRTRYSPQPGTYFLIKDFGDGAVTIQYVIKPINVAGYQHFSGVKSDAGVRRKLTKIVNGFRKEFPAYDLSNINFDRYK